MRAVCDIGDFGSILESLNPIQALHVNRSMDVRYRLDSRI